VARNVTNGRKIMLVRKALAISVAAASVLACSSIASVAEERFEARQVAESIVKSFMATYDARDPKAVSALFLPNAMLLGFNGAVSRGRGAIERTYAAGLKNLGGHYTIVINDAIPLGSNVVVADDEVKIAGAGRRHSNETINGRAVITLVKTPNGWQYAAISAQKLPSPEGTTSPANR
jgi:uncharacterized protein (TIGR02246 family)